MSEQYIKINWRIYPSAGHVLIYIKGKTKKFQMEECIYYDSWFLEWRLKRIKKRITKCLMILEKSVW